MSETSQEAPAQEQEQPNASESEQPENPDTPEESEDDDSPEQRWDPEKARKQIRKLNSENENLRKRVNEAPKADDVKDLQKQNTDLGSENLRLRVGYKLGLPLEMTDRLKGDTEDELVADAEKLVELIAPAKRPTTRKPTETLRGGGQPDQEPEETDVRKLGERIFQR